MLSNGGSAFQPSAAGLCNLFDDAQAPSGTIEPRFGQFAPPFKQDTGDLGHARVHLLQAAQDVLMLAARGDAFGFSLGEP